jgi:hypothetical protein
MIRASATGHADGSDSVDVTDDDDPTVTLVIADDAISENLGSTTATVTRNTDTSDALPVALTNSDTSEANVPTEVTIPAGQASASFDIDGVDDAIVDGIQVVTVTASAIGHNVCAGSSDSLAVTDDDVPELMLEIADDAIDENAGTTTATVTRNTDTTDPLLVTLASDDTSKVTVPDDVTIPSGQASASFDVVAVDDALSDGTLSINITASAAGFTDGSSAIDVTEDDVPALTLTIADNAVTEDAGAAATTATVTRNTVTTDPLLVTLASDDTSEATVPPEVTIPAGQASASFDVDAVDDAIVDGTQSVTLNASAAGLADGVDSLDVLDNEARRRFPLTNILMMIDE